MKPTFQNIVDFRPPWYLRSGHLQTLLTGFYKPRCEIDGEVCHLVPIGEYGHLSIHENQPQQGSARHDEAIFLLHGLGSSYRGTYMSRIASILVDAGARVFRFDLPGAGESYRHTPLPPHGACSELIWQSICFLSNKCGIRTWKGAGVSLGGNLLLKLLANHANDLSQTADFQIKKAISIAPPIDLDECCKNMERSPNQIYAKYFLRSLRKQSITRAKLWPQWQAKLKGASFRTIRDFDETVTAGLAGFRDANEYYKNGSSKNDLVNINVDTTVLIDRHDPIVPFYLFGDSEVSRSISIYTTRRGGHVGYLGHHQGSIKLSRWADDWIAKRLLE